MNTATIYQEPVVSSEPRHVHGVCWAAILAGAAAACALSLILLMLGVGLGLSSVSPWSFDSGTAGALGMATIGWLTFTQLAASGMGGYLAGRLRTRWVPLHADEVHFRDTAHGFLAWSIATLVTAGLMGAAVGGIVSTGAKAGGAVVAGGAAATAAAAVPAMSDSSGAGMRSSGSPAGYYVDALFRRAAAPADAASAPSSNATSATNGMNATSSAKQASATAPAASSDTNAQRTAEVGRILLNAGTANALPPEDSSYLAQLVAERTGLSTAEAQARVNDTFKRMQDRAAAAKEEARVAADKARKASAGVALWGFISLLIGAFVASYLATVGGRNRDVI